MRRPGQDCRACHTACPVTPPLRLAGMFLAGTMPCRSEGSPHTARGSYRHSGCVRQATDAKKLFRSACRITLLMGSPSGKELTFAYIIQTNVLQCNCKIWGTGCERPQAAGPEALKAGNRIRERLRESKRISQPIVCRANKGKDRRHAVCRRSRTGDSIPEALSVRKPEGYGDHGFSTASFPMIFSVLPAPS